jgi:Reverse transcriptase (RNA-dependent DNA polymerase)
MPFGLKNAPAFFQRMMTKLLGDLIGKICLVYIDDVVIWGDTAEECLANVQRVVRLLRRHGLLCNGEKCCLLSTRIELLGHVIERGRV